MYDKVKELYKSFRRKPWLTVYRRLQLLHRLKLMNANAMMVRRSLMHSIRDMSEQKMQEEQVLEIAWLDDGFVAEFSGSYLDSIVNLLVQLRSANGDNCNKHRIQL